MSTIKISQLPAVTTVAPNSDVLPLVSGGVTTKATPKDIIDAALANPGTLQTLLVGPEDSANFTRFPNAITVVSDTALAIQKNESHNAGTISEGTALYFTRTISGSAGVPTITVSSATNLYVGMLVTGTGIASGDVTITNIVGTTLTLSANNASSVSGTGTFIAIGVGLYGVAYTDGVARCGGVIGEGHVSASADTGSAIGVRGYSNDTHAGGLNIGLYGDASGGSSSYSLYLNNGDIYSATAKTWSFGAGSLTVSAPVTVTGTFTASTITASTITASSGSLTVSAPVTVTGTFTASTITASTITSSSPGTINNLSIGATTPLAGTFTTALANSTLGYTTGAGGTVTQATSKATAVTLNKTCGQITMNAASLAANTSVAFTLTNSTIAATDTIIVNISSGGTTLSYLVGVEAVAAGSCNIIVRNISAGALAQALVLNFSVIKAVNA